MMASTTDDILLSITATEEAIVELLDRLDAREKDEGSNDRTSDRFNFRMTSCSVTIKQIGAATPVTTLVPTRNLSSGGMSFLHGGFVHTGSFCEAELVTSEGTHATVSGLVTRCRYVENWLHEVAIRFHLDIRPADFSRDAPAWHVLIGSNDEQSVRQASHHLSVKRATTTVASSGAELLELTQSRAYDCILVDVDLPEGGADLVGTLRERGYAGMILGVGDDDTESAMNELLAAGCTKCLTRPYTPDMIEDLRDAVSNGS
ncbi:MAG: response regulator [bacterium]|nr:response regulator [bacterium]